MNANVGVNPWFRFSHTPLVLRAYLLFVLAAAVAFVGAFFPPVSAAIVPYTAWSGLAFYLFTLYPAMAAILTPRRILIHNVAALLGVAVVIGAFDTFQHTWGTEAGAPDFGNPYLTYHPYRPVFTIALPAFWLSLLASPTVRKWVKSASQ